MKNFPAILFTIIFCAFGAAAQQEDAAKRERIEGFPGGFAVTCGPCGCDGSTPSRWDVIYGKAVTIVDSDTIVIESFRIGGDDSTEDVKNRYTIDLIGIDAGGNEAAVITYLQKTILNRRVNASVKWKTVSNLTNSGVVYNVDGENFLAVNEYLLEKGFVKYKKIDGNALDDAGDTDCRFKLLEKKAKETKAGIWAK